MAAPAAMYGSCPSAWVVVVVGTEVWDDWVEVALLGVVCVDGGVVDVTEDPDELNSRTLLLPGSTAHKLPDESKPGMPTPKNPYCVVAFVYVVKSCWPITSEAAIPVLNGDWNSSNLLLPYSATHRFPVGSKATT